MDLKITGQFIKEQRKEKELTQAELAAKLMVSEKTISKWECGNGFPDTTLMLPLCKVLEVSANELLSGKKLNDEEYKEKAEEHLVEMQAEKERQTRLLLHVEYILGFLSCLILFIPIFIAAYVEMATVWRVVLIIAGVPFFIVGFHFCMVIETKAGYYECKHCENKYVPTLKQTYFAMHMGRTRYMKFPKCGKYSWQKKVINKD